MGGSKSIAHTLVRWTPIAGGISALLGVAVLVGWHVHSFALVQVLPAFVPMQYNTALGFLLSGVGFGLAAYRKSLAAAIIGGVTAALGALTLIEYLAGVNLGIDELLMEHYVTVETSHPGRMAPNTAVCFVLAGLSLIVMHVRIPIPRRMLILGLIGSTIAGLGAVALAGYLTGVESI